MPKSLALWVIYTQIANNILEEVFEKHPDIVNRAIVRFIKEG